MRRKARLDIAGALAIVASLAGAAAFTSYAVKADAARGLSVADSLCTAGIGCGSNERAKIRARLAGRPVVLAESAVEPRLVGYCSGKLLVAAEEDAFPAPCAWIERADAIELPNGQRVTVY